MAWRVGNGQSVRIGLDGIVGCDTLVDLSEGLVNFLQVSRRVSLDKVNDKDNSTIWEQKRFSAEDLNVPLEWKEE